MEINSNPSKDYQASEMYIESDNPDILAVSHRLKGKTPDDVAENTFKWVMSNLTPSSYASKPKGALHALISKKGDCTEYSYLVAALARAKGIKARQVSGFVVDKSSMLTGRDYHDWTEVFLDGKWRIIDAIRGKIKSEEDNYIAFRVSAPNEAATSQSKGFVEFLPKNKNLKITVN